MDDVASNLLACIPPFIAGFAAVMLWYYSKRQVRESHFVSSDAEWVMRHSQERLAEIQERIRDVAQRQHTARQTFDDLNRMNREIMTRHITIDSHGVVRDGQAVVFDGDTVRDTAGNVLGRTVPAPGDGSAATAATNDENLREIQWHFPQPRDDESSMRAREIMEQHINQSIREEYQRIQERQRQQVESLVTIDEQSFITDQHIETLQRYADSQERRVLTSVSTPSTSESSGRNIDEIERRMREAVRQSGQYAEQHDRERLSRERQQQRQSTPATIFHNRIRRIEFEDGSSIEGDIMCHENRIGRTGRQLVYISIGDPRIIPKPSHQPADLEPTRQIIMDAPEGAS